MAWFLMDDDDYPLVHLMQYDGFTGNPAYSISAYSS